LSSCSSCNMHMHTVGSNPANTVIPWPVPKFSQRKISQDWTIVWFVSHDICWDRLSSNTIGARKLVALGWKRVVSASSILVCNSSATNNCIILVLATVMALKLNSFLGPTTPCRVALVCSQAQLFKFWLVTKQLNNVRPQWPCNILSQVENLDQTFFVNIYRCWKYLLK
jgi:hypothetical protein